MAWAGGNERLSQGAGSRLREVLGAEPPASAKRQVRGHGRGERTAAFGSMGVLLKK